MTETALLTVTVAIELVVLLGAGWSVIAYLREEADEQSRSTSDRARTPTGRESRQ
ncbi:MAG: hypothetical protein ABEH80_04625 [Halobaculum sp.]